MYSNANCNNNNNNNGSKFSPDINSKIKGPSKEKLKEMNLFVLKRNDVSILDILQTFDHAVLYKFDESTHQWVRKDVAGPLFIIKRNNKRASHTQEHAFVVMNRLNTENLIEEISHQLELQIQAPYVIYRNSQGFIHGVWFHNFVQCLGFVDSLNKLISKQSNNNITTTSNGNVNNSDSTNKTNQILNSIFGKKSTTDINKNPTVSNTSNSHNTTGTNGASALSIINSFLAANNSKSSSGSAQNLPEQSNSHIPVMMTHEELENMHLNHVQQPPHRDANLSNNMDALNFDNCATFEHMLLANSQLKKDTHALLNGTGVLQSIPNNASPLNSPVFTSHAQTFETNPNSQKQNSTSLGPQSNSQNSSSILNSLIMFNANKAQNNTTSSMTGHCEVSQKQPADKTLELLNGFSNMNLKTATVLDSRNNPPLLATTSTANPKTATGLLPPTAFLDATAPYLSSNPSCTISDKDSLRQAIYSLLEDDSYMDALYAAFQTKQSITKRL